MTTAVLKIRTGPGRREQTVAALTDASVHVPLISRAAVFAQISCESRATAQAVLLERLISAHGHTFGLGSTPWLMEVVDADRAAHAIYCTGHTVRLPGAKERDDPARADEARDTDG